jgi:hypothetical protein
LASLLWRRTFLPNPWCFLPDMYSHRMSVGLKMTTEEWTELRAQVDDSFWVMRIIGEHHLAEVRKHWPFSII